MPSPACASPIPPEKEAGRKASHRARSSTKREYTYRQSSAPAGALAAVLRMQRIYIYIYIYIRVKSLGEKVVLGPPRLIAALSKTKKDKERKESVEKRSC